MTTCYANPRAEEGKRGEGGTDGKDSFRQGLCVCVCAGRRNYAHAGFVCVCACVVIVCLSCVLVEKCPVVHVTTGWELSPSR